MPLIGTKEGSFVDIPRAVSSSRKCVICHRKYSSINVKLRRVKYCARLDVYLQREILIPYGTRACSNHIDDFGYLNQDAIEKIRIFKKSIFMSRKELTRTFEFLRFAALKNTHFNKFEDVASLPANDCFKLTGKKNRQTLYYK